MLQKLVEIMPDTVVVRLTYVTQDVIKTTMRLLLVCANLFFLGANFSDSLEPRYSLPRLFRLRHSRYAEWLEGKAWV